MTFPSPGRIANEEEEASANKEEEEDRTEVLPRRNQRKEHKKPATKGKGFLTKQKPTSTRRTTPSTPHPTACKTKPNPTHEIYIPVRFLKSKEFHCLV